MRALVECATYVNKIIIIIFIIIITTTTTKTTAGNEANHRFLGKKRGGPWKKLLVFRVLGQTSTG